MHQPASAVGEPSKRPADDPNKALEDLFPGQASTCPDARPASPSVILKSYPDIQGPRWKF
ncbi:unnamed protein product [Ixodes hexagonus]